MIKNYGLGGDLFSYRATFNAQWLSASIFVLNDDDDAQRNGP